MANPFEKVMADVANKAVSTAQTSMSSAVNGTISSYTAPVTGALNTASSLVAKGGTGGGGGASGSWGSTNIQSQASYSNEGRSVPSMITAAASYGNEGRTTRTDIVVPSKKDSTVPNDEDQGKFGYKVRLFAARRFPTERVIFEVSPTLSESRTVEYAGVNPVHMPGSIQIYKRTNSRTWSLGAKFISRNTSQATENMKYLQLLRGWTMPYFGLRSNYDRFTTADEFTTTNREAIEDGTAMLGAPPDVLYLYAYSDSKNSTSDRTSMAETNIKKMPVVITSLSFDYSPEVDYIATASGEPFPVKMEVKIDLTETHSPNGYEEFSLSMFKNGQLVQF